MSEQPHGSSVRSFILVRGVFREGGGSRAGLERPGASANFLGEFVRAVSGGEEKTLNMRGFF